MIFEELERTLPNGFHDSELLDVQVLFDKAMVILTIVVDWSRPLPAPDPASVFERKGRLCFSDVLFISIDPSIIGARVQRPITVDAGTGQPRTAPIPLPSIPPDAFACWFFLTDTNSFIRIVANTVELDWLDGP